MFVECGKCGSIYEIDQGLVKPEGAKARCSVCGNIFAVVHETPAPGQESPTQIEGVFEGEVKGDDAVAPLSNNDIDDLLKELDKPSNTGKISSKESPADLELNGKTDRIKVTDHAESMRAKGVAGAGLRPYRFEQKVKRSYVSTIILLILLFFVGAAGSVIYFAPEMIPWKIPFLAPTDKPAKQESAVKLISFNDLKGAFIDSQPLGKLFVVRGMVGNRSGRPRGLILVRVTILDDKGKSVRSAQAYAGNNLENHELASMDMSGIQSVMENRTGKENLNVSVAPGAAIPFMVVFDRLPENLGEFIVEPLSSVEVSN